MKHAIKNWSAKISLTFFSLLSAAYYAMAQDSASSNTESNTVVSHSQSTAPVQNAAMWYTNPIVWVVGGAVLLIIIILAVRSGNSSRTTSTTTTRDGGISRNTTTTITED